MNLGNQSVIIDLKILKTIKRPTLSAIILNFSYRNIY